MKYKFYLTLLAMAGFFIMDDVSAQFPMADTVFNFEYNDAVNGMLVTETGECILVGKMAFDSLTPKNIWVKRFGFQGDTIVTQQWEKIFVPPVASRVGAVEWTQDGNFIIAGSWNSNNMILKMSPEGDSISTILVSGTADTYFKDVIELANGDFILLQNDVSLDLYSRLLRINSTGSVIWETVYDDRYYSSIEFYNADTMMVAGYEIHQTYQHILFGAFSPVNGSELYSNIYQDNYGTNFTMEADSGAVYLGNSKSWLTNPSFVAQVIRMNPSGELEWEVDFTGIGSETIKDIHVYDNYLLTCSERVAANKIVIGAITFDGTLAATFSIPKPIPEVVAVDTWGNNLFVTGRQFNYANGKDIFFMRYNLDSLFVITGQQEISTSRPVVVYPNPADEEIRIEAAGELGRKIVGVQVFSLGGNLELELHGHSSMIRVPVSSLPQGLHLVAVRFDQGPPVVEKILVVH